MIKKVKDLERIKKIPENNKELLRNIVEKLNNLRLNNRKLMYSDIINYITRRKILNEDHIDIIVWCNYKIRFGEFYVNATDLF